MDSVEAHIRPWEEQLFHNEGKEACSLDTILLMNYQG